MQLHLSQPFRLFWAELALPLPWPLHSRSGSSNRDKCSRVRNKVAGRHDLGGTDDNVGRLLASCRHFLLFGDLRGLRSVHGQLCRRRDCPHPSGRGRHQEGLSSSTRDHLPRLVLHGTIQRLAHALAQQLVGPLDPPLLQLLGPRLNLPPVTVATERVDTRGRNRRVIHTAAELVKVLPKVALGAPLEEDLTTSGLQAQHVPQLALPSAPLKVEPSHGPEAARFPKLDGPALRPKHVVLAEPGVLVVAEGLPVPVLSAAETLRILSQRPLRKGVLLLRRVQ